MGHSLYSWKPVMGLGRARQKEGGSLGPSEVSLEEGTAQNLNPGPGQRGVEREKGLHPK